MKLIDLLVKELPKRGGWPESANYVAQDYNGTVKFSKSINFLHIKVGEWCSNEDGDDWIYGDRPFEGNFIHHTIAHDRNSSIVTREQYEAALASSEGWIEWHGGECPVDSEEIVEVRYRKPNPYQYNNDRAGDFTWSHDGIDGDIIAYRLHTKDINSHEKDDQLEQDLNECIVHGADTAWNGEGLPPVGCECEVSVDGGNTWCSYKALNEKNGMRLVEIGNFTEDFQSNNWTFRPIHSEADKKREEAINKIQSHCHVEHRAPISAGQAIALYDAIAAGKIPGVKLEGK